MMKHALVACTILIAACDGPTGPVDSGGGSDRAVRSGEGDPAANETPAGNEGLSSRGTARRAGPVPPPHGGPPGPPHAAPSGGAGGDDATTVSAGLDPAGAGGTGGDLTTVGTGTEPTGTGGAGGAPTVGTGTDVAGSGGAGGAPTVSTGTDPTGTGGAGGAQSVAGPGAGGGGGGGESTTGTESGSGGNGGPTTSGGYAPGGTDASVQINDGGALYGDDGFSYDKAARSVAGGVGTSATGPQSMAWGNNCSATGDQSFAGSMDATASGHNSFAWGYDVWTANTYGVSLGAHIDNLSVAAVSIGENLANGPNSANAVGLGFQNSIGENAPYAVALGSYVSIDDGATGAFVCGVNATARRPGQFQHSSGAGFGLFAGTAWIDLHALRSGSRGELVDRAGKPFLLDLASYSVLTVELLAVTKNGAKRAFETRKIEAVCSNVGAVNIVSNTVISGEGNLAAQGWGLEVTSPGAQELRFTVDPGADTVAFGARLAWSQMGGINALP